MGGVLSSSSSDNARKAKKPPAGSVSNVDRAMLDLKHSRDRLSRYQKKLEQDEGKLVQRAKQAKTEGQTKVALNLLKLRKIKQREVETVEAQLLNVLQMVQTIDSKQNEAQMLAAMSKGKDALQKMHQETTVDDVLDLMDKIEEQNQVEKEISDILQGSPELSVEDEAAVEAELEALIMEQNMANTELPSVPTSKPLPDVPTTELPTTAVASGEKRVAVPS